MYKVIEVELFPFSKTLVGLDRQAAKEKFAAFLDGQTNTADQIRFVNYIIDHLTQNGTMKPVLLYESPFTDIHFEGPGGLFTNTQTEELLKVLVDVNESVSV